MTISTKFRAAIKLSKNKSYQIAQAAGLHPSTLSKIVCGIDKVKLGDKRVMAVGKVLGLAPDECFTCNKTEK